MYFKSIKMLKVQKKQAVSFILLAAVWILVITYCDNSDYGTYFADYCRLVKSGRAVLSRNYEIGFYACMRLSAAFHLPFELFFAVYMSVELYLLWRFIKRYAIHKSFILMACIMFPYIYYIQQIRSSMAVMIVLNGIVFLHEPSAGRNAWKFILSCIAASCFHKTSLFYMVFLLARYLSKKSLKRLVLILNAAVPAVLYFFYDSMVSVLKIIFHDFWMIDYYFKRTFTPQKYTFFLSGIYLVLFFVLIYMDTQRRSSADSAEYKLFYKLSLLVCGFALLSYFTVLADRIPGMAVPVVYLTIDMNAREGISRFKKKITKTACLVFAAVYLLFFIGPWNPQSHDRFFYEMWRQRPDRYSVTYIGDKL